MKSIFFVLGITFTLNLAAQEKTIVFDSILAKQVGADAYGMKKYYMVYLKDGKRRDQDSATVAKIQRGHMDNINKLASEGKLILAGPFFDDTDVRGIFILTAKTMEEAEAWTQTDPAVKSGRLVMEIHPWYGSASLMLIPDLHKKVAKIEF